MSELTFVGTESVDETAAEHVAPAGPPAAVRRGRVLRRVLRQPLAAAALVFLAIVVLAAIFAPWLAPYDPNQQDLLIRLQGPSSEHWLGVDDFGRDQLSRLIYGARVSLTASVEAVSIGGIIGVTLGMLAGYAGGRLDGLLGRSIDILMALPGLLFAITVVTVLGPGLTNAMIAVGVLLIPPFFRVARASTQAVREETYIEASRALGCTTRRIVARHVLPNMLAPVMVQVAILLGLAITIEASLSFIGLGAQPPTATWGSMLSTANSFMADAPHLVYVPGAMIAITVLAFSLLGDGLAKAFGTTRTAVGSPR
jgi:peptide/nickel transport system permease protein